MHDNNGMGEKVPVWPQFCSTLPNNVVPCINTFLLNQCCKSSVITGTIEGNLVVPIDTLGVQSEDKILATYYNIEICQG